MANSIFEDDFNSGDITGYSISGYWQTPGTADKYLYSVSPVLSTYGYDQQDSASLTKNISSAQLSQANYFEIKLKTLVTNNQGPNSHNDSIFTFLSNGTSSKSITLMHIWPGNTSLTANGFSYNPIGLSQDTWYIVKIYLVGINIRVQTFDVAGNLIDDQTNNAGTPISNPDRIILSRFTNKSHYFGNSVQGFSSFDNLKVLQLAPKVTATNLISTPISCIEPCSTSVDITWRNDGELTGSFEPAIIVDGIRTGMTQISLPAGQTVMRTFQLSNIMRGTHTLCPDPN